MEFGNPIVGQEDLIRSAIKSPDFGATEPSQTGVSVVARGDAATTDYLVTSDLEAADISIGDTVQIFKTDGNVKENTVFTVTSMPSAFGFTNITFEPFAAVTTKLNETLRVVIDPQQAISGWRIARDGSATFNNLTIGSSNFVIDSDGNAVFAEVSANSILLDGENLQSLLDVKAEGPKSIVGLLGDTGGYNGTKLLIGRLIIPNFNGTREYAIGGSGVHFDKQAITGFSRLTVQAYIAWDTPATALSQQLTEYQFLSDASSGSDWILSWYHPFGISSPLGTNLHIAWFYATNVSNPLGLRCVGTDIGTPGARLFALDVGQNVNFQTFNMGTGTSVQQYTKTYFATGSSSFQSDGDNRGVSECYQGYYSGTNGNQFSLIAFDYSLIQSDTSGSTINKIELYLNNNHFYFFSGGEALIGMHNETSVSGNHPVSDVLDDRASTPAFNKGQAKWVTLPTVFGERLRDNTRKGIALGPASSNSNNDYGYFAGDNQSGQPRLRITYTK